MGLIGIVGEIHTRALLAKEARLRARHAELAASYGRDIRTCTIPEVPHTLEEAQKCFEKDMKEAFDFEDVVYKTKPNRNQIAKPLSESYLAEIKEIAKRNWAATCSHLPIRSTK